MKKLITLDKYKTQMAFGRKWAGWKYSGVACPKCKHELMMPIIVEFNDKECLKCSYCNVEYKI